MKYPDDFINKVINDDCLKVLKEIPDNSVDAVITDPPYNLTSIVKRFGKEKSAKAKYGSDGRFQRLSGGFMGKKWDGTGIAFKKEVWEECYRILKPGGHLISFGGTRTYHRMACAVEDAGFEIRDMIEWVYASGFPKSLNIGKAFDKKACREELEKELGRKPTKEEFDKKWKGFRKKIGERPDFVARRPKKNFEQFTSVNPSKKGINSKVFSEQMGIIAEPRTELAKKWEHYGTALKPAHEPIVLARKPLSEKTIVDNVLKWGVSGLDIAGTRIPIDADKENDKRIEGKDKQIGAMGKAPFGKKTGKDVNISTYKPEGRFPANVIVQDDALNDGEMTKATGRSTKKQSNGIFGRFGNISNIKDSGSKSRYFDIDIWAEKQGILQIPKASKSEKNKGSESLEKKRTAFKPGGAFDDPNKTKEYTKMPNYHPTVKPIKLMSWLIKLVSKEGDIVLDPFLGSGTTAVACILLKRNFIGIEKEKEYCKIAEARINGYVKGDK